MLETESDSDLIARLVPETEDKDYTSGDYDLYPKKLLLGYQ